MHRRMSSAGLALAAACFVLPFIQLSCAGETGLTLSGIEFAVGKTIQTESAFGVPEVEEVPGNNLALAALVVVVVGTLAALIRTISLRVLGAFGVAALILLLSAKYRTDRRIALEGQGVVYATYLSGFWLAVSLSGLAGVVGLVGQARSQRKDPAQSADSEPPSATSAAA